MEIEAPTFNSLNKPQKRALILRDQLRWYAPQHLDSFIEGLDSPEPPAYKKINGVTKPDLSFVALKNSASRFDLGNVIFPEEDKGILHAYLTLEDGKIEMHTEEALPQTDQNLDHIAIHGFIASTMVPMFKDKIGMIMARINKVNDARRAAYNSPTIGPVRIGSGETLSRLQEPRKMSHGGLSSSDWKREPNTPITPHITNKRPVTGLSLIPVTLKAATFAAIPEQIKIDLFNNIASTAFPNFDNLMIASWNVVSVYSACGSDFPEMHKAVVELKDVLQDFDAAFGAKVSRTPVQYRSDWAGETQSSSSAARALPSASNKARVQVEESRKVAVPDSVQLDEDTEMIDHEGGHLSDADQDLSAPKILHQDEESDSDSDSGDDAIPARRLSNSHARQPHERRKPPSIELSPPRFPHRTRTPTTSLPSRTPSAPPPVRLTPTLTSVHKLTARNTKEFVPPTSAQESSITSPETVSNQSPSSDQSAELTRRRNEWAASQSKTIKNGAKKSQVSHTMSAVPLQQGHSPSVNVTAPTPRAVSSWAAPVASSVFLPRTSPAPHAIVPYPGSATASPAPIPAASSPAAPASSPAVNKRKASGSPTPGLAKKKLLTSYTTAQIQDKARMTKTHIMRSWNSLDPEIVPKQYLELLKSFHAELDRRRQVENAKDGPTAQPISSPSIQQVYGRDGAPDPEEQHLEHRIQDRTEDCGKEPTHKSSQQEPSPHRPRERTPQRTPERTTTTTGISEPRPIVKGMFGAYLGKSMLGAKKSSGIAPVAPMFGTSPRKDGGGGSAEGAAGAGAGASASGSGEKRW